MIDDRKLREKARDAIQAGELPDRRPDRTWGGPGFGADCTVCRAPVKRDEMEIEIEFARDGNDPGFDKYRVHTRCLAAWEFALDQMQSATPAAMAGGSSELSPDTTVRRRVLPEMIEVGKMADCGCEKTYKRGPA